MKVGKAGAIEVVVEAMKTHKDDINVCYQGCGALRNIAANGKQ